MKQSKERRRNKGPKVEHEAHETISFFESERRVAVFPLVSGVSSHQQQDTEVTVELLASTEAKRARPSPKTGQKEEKQASFLVLCDATVSVLVWTCYPSAGKHNV